MDVEINITIAEEDDWTVDVEAGDMYAPMIVTMGDVRWCMTHKQGQALHAALSEWFEEVPHV
jgi:hypothetical protein